MQGTPMPADETYQIGSVNYRELDLFTFMMMIIRVISKNKLKDKLK